ncbi:chemotaxis protein MotD [Agrobacterium larrymoorei]|uniref:Chemotaxis protein MotD n=1 Tax=Agrobacterium larrymoorei TaxID=160699 RepID=A0AAJ2BCF8_9HYPH|nr:flagellar hook-length control protein FliK [Agrobacterium larrymoorei]MDR6104203.1 chemotaxis protein MotD [Agrobacterium larrymoorei]
MNVLSNLVPSHTEAVKVTNSRDRGGSSKQGASGFSDALGTAGDRNARQPAPANNANARSKAQDSDRAQSTSSSTVSTDTKQTLRDRPASKPQDDAPTRAANADGKQPAAKDDVTDEASESKPSLLLKLVDPSLSVQTAPVTPAAQEAPAVVEEPAASLADLVKFIETLTKATNTTEGPVEGDKGDTEGDKSADETDVTDVPGTSADLMSLLAATTMPKDQPVTPAHADAKAKPTDGATLLPVGPSSGDDQALPATVVRLAKADAPAIDLHIASHEDGSLKVDASLSSAPNVDVVQVLDSRRYLALAPTSNAANVTASMASDPDWATAMAAKASGAPLVTTTGQVVHTLKIQMSPVELGHVTAAMKLVGDELSVHLTAHTLKGYAELQKDSSAILDALKSQGFSVDQVTVSLSSASDRQDNTSNNRQPNDLNQQGAQQGGQRGNEDRSQEQFYRQTRPNAPEEVNGNDISAQPETLPRDTSARPDHVYL